MLKKLFKYDWKSFWKVPAVINLFLAVVTLIGIVSLVTPFWNLEGDIIEVLMATSILIYIMAIMAGSLGVTVYTAIRFYKSLYTDEGYLTNTLPVTPWQLLLSKMFTGAIWYLITDIVVSASMFLLILTASSTYENVNVFRELGRIFQEASAMFERELGISMAGFIAFILIYSIIACFFSILMMYSAVSLGQLFTGHKVMGAVIWYIAEYVIIQTGSSLLINLPAGIYNAAEAPPALIIKPLLAIIMILTVILSVVLFFVSEYMLRKKLNLD